MKRFMKLAMMAVVIALALGAMGIAYTGWADTVTVTSTTGTGTMAIKMYQDPNSPSSSNGGAWWAAAWQNPNGSFTTNSPIPAGQWHMDSVCNVSFSDKALTIVGKNWAPGLVCRGDVVIKNEGTMPIILESFVPAPGAETNAPMDWQCYEEGTQQTLPITLVPGAVRQCSGFLQSIPVGATQGQSITAHTTFTAQARMWNK